MFQTLLESRTTVVDRRRRWTLASAGLHAAIVSLVAVLTMPNEQPRFAERVIDVWPWVPPKLVSESPAQSEPTRPAAPLLPTTPILRVPVVPSFDPSIDFDRRARSRTEVFLDAPPLMASPVYVPGTVLSADRVDRQVMPWSGNGQPSYPEALRTSSVEGEVMARFVVDTLGRVEPLSITVLAATHPLFAAAVSRWLTRTSYVPAEYAGHVVRQLVEQRFQFTLRR